MAENESSTPSQLGEGDGKTTASATPDARNSGTHGVSSQPRPGAGTSSKPGQSGGARDSSLAGHEKRSPFVEMLTSRIKQKQQREQEKMSMEISPHMMRAFQNELGHLRREKQASILSAIGKGVIGLGLKGGAKGGLLQRGTKAVSQGARRMAGTAAGGRKIVGAAALGAGALGAAGIGAAVS